MAAERVIVIGGGFTGLAAAYELSLRGVPVTLLEADATLGGLAGSFETAGGTLEKFYHHWYLSDRAILGLIEELGLGERVLQRRSRTGLYYANTVFRLSRPLDLLRFKPLSLIDRVRLGWLAVRVRWVRDWRRLENISVREWLISLAGAEVYRIVWEPLLRGKFGAYADEIAAVWLWNKLKLRGSSRGSRGAEELAYLQGGFGVLVERLADEIRSRGGEIQCGTRVERIECTDGRVRGVRTESGVPVGVERKTGWKPIPHRSNPTGTEKGEIKASRVLVTTAIPPFVRMCPDLPAEYVERISGIRYLANVCLVLVLRRSLSDTYWLNVNDPSFPFVAIIEHTNFEPPESYAGRRLVYLSKYLDERDPLFAMNDAQWLAFALPHIQRMFPTFSAPWIEEHFVWRAQHSQPIVSAGYAQRIPAFATPIAGLTLCTMAQIYPEDRGTNYAVEYGRRVARELAAGRL